MQKFKIWASLCSWSDWFESYLVGNAKDRLSHDEAHILLIRKFSEGLNFHLWEVSWESNPRKIAELLCCLLM